MSKALATNADMTKKLEEVLIGGDLSGLTTSERVTYYNAVCDSVGLNPLTKPFEYIKLNGKLVLYARRDATDQLRKIHSVSVTKLEKETIGELLYVTAYGRDRFGREDVGTGVISTAGLKGEALANAHMKGETKAKRRLTLSICGLGLLDETEVDSVTREVSNTKANQVNALLNDSAEIELEDISSEEIEEPDFAEAAPEPPFDLGEFEIKIGKKYKGKKLKDVSPSTLREFADWVEKNVENKNDATQEFLMMASSYLKEQGA